MSELEQRAERLADTYPSLASLRTALRKEFPQASTEAINLAALKALGEWR